MEDLKLSRLARNQLLEIYLDKDKDALHAWLLKHFEIDIPRVAVCVDHGHCAPFDAFSYAFLNGGTDVLWIGGRGTGKTLNVAAINALNSLAHDGCEVLSAGAVEEQGEKCYGYFQDLIRLPAFASIYDPRYARLHATEFKNGSRSTVATATVKQFNGPHPQKFQLDELELVDREPLKESKFMVMGTPNIDGQTLYTTSRKYPFGHAESLIAAINESRSEVKLFIWCVFDALQTCQELFCAPCKRRVREDGKSFYDICVLRRDVPDGPGSNGDDQMRAKLADGHYPLRQVWKNFVDPDIGAADFDSQVLSLSPSRESLVFPMFNEDVHVVDDDFVRQRLDGLQAPIEVDLSIDHGFRDPAVVLFGFDLGEEWLIVDEIYETGKLPSELKDMTDERLAYWGWEEGSTVADPSRTDNLVIYRRAGFNISEANTNIDSGIEAIQRAFRWVPVTAGNPEGLKPRFYIHKRCRNLISDVKPYHWKAKDPNDISENQRKKPDPNQSDHGCDALRYWAMAHEDSTGEGGHSESSYGEGEFNWDSGFSYQQDEGW